MACTAISIPSGNFAAKSWSTAANPSTSGPQFTVQRTTGGGNVSISWTGPGGSDVITVSQANHDLKHIVWGGSRTFLLVLNVETGVGNQVAYHMTLIDLVTPGTPGTNLITTPLKQSFSNPTVSVSGGNGDAVFCFVTDQDDQTYGLGIYRSDNGDSFFPVVPPFPTQNVFTAKATATELQIIYQNAVYASGPIPAGSLDLPNSLSFPDVAVGGCAQPVNEKDLTLTNDGDDCLSITAIGSSTHFVFQPASLPLPATISPGDNVKAKIRFAAGNSPGNFSESVTVTRSPANGDSSVTCTGKAVQAEPDINTNVSTLDFGTVASGSSPQQKSFTIKNDGTKSATAQVSASPSGQFSWNQLSDSNFDCGEQHQVQVTFTVPNTEGDFSGDVFLTSNDPNAPAKVHLKAHVCVPNAEVVLPNSFPAYGNVEQGYRLLKMIKVQNPGDALLTFNAGLSGPDAGLFGLMQESNSITDTVPSRSYEVEQGNACGAPAGSGSKQLAVVFFASAAPSAQPKTATLTLSNFNVTGQGSKVYNLSATITQPVPIDCVAVIDKSGSMGDPVPGGSKMAAAIRAAQLLPQLLPPDLGHRFGGVRFNQAADAFEGISAITTGNQSAKINSISGANLSPGGNTSIAAGVQVGGVEIAKGTIGQRQALVVLSDGKDNTPVNLNGDWFTILGFPAIPDGQLFPVSTSKLPLPPNVKIHTIALGQDSDVDKASLEFLATQSGGTFHALNPFNQEMLYELMKLYTLIYMDIADVTPITDPVFVIQPGETFKIPFDVLRGDVGGLIVVYDLQGIRLPFWLESPAGELLDANYLPVGFQLRPGFSVATRHLDFKVPLGEPERYAGQWNIIIQHPKKACTGSPVTGKDAPLGFTPRRCKDNYLDPVKFGIAIGVGSNFRMQAFVSPEQLFVGDKIWLDAVITEAGLRVPGCDVEVTTTSPDGTVWPPIKLKDNGLNNDGDASDGEYADYFKWTSQGGTYNFHFRATGFSRDGEPVVREVQRSKYLYSKSGEPGIPPGRPQSDDCCKELLREIRRHTALLKKIAEGPAVPKVKPRKTR